jgi:hypothetical protein
MAVRPTSLVGNPVPSADQVWPFADWKTPTPHSAARKRVAPLSMVTTTLECTPGRRRTHAGAPEGGSTRWYNPAVVAATTFSRFCGSTARAKNASPASAGEPASVSSLTQVSPPSSVRMGPIPR